MEDLYKIHTETQVLIDKTLIDIGLKYAHYTLKHDNSLISIINENVELYQKLATQLKVIEDKIKNQ